MTPRRRLRLWLSLAAVAGIAIALLQPASGCVGADQCILVVNKGNDYCKSMSGAMAWPIGQPEMAQPVVDMLGEAPLGCKCMHYAEAEALDTFFPSDLYALLNEDIELDARFECNDLAPDGYDNNCFQLEGGGAPVFPTPPFKGSVGTCTGSCGYINPPVGGSCPEDPKPWECPDPLGEGETGLDDEAGKPGGM